MSATAGPARPWTAAEVRRAIAWRQGGMARAAIAERLGRSIDAGCGDEWRARR